MTRRTKILLSIIIGSATISVAGFLALKRFLRVRLALDFHRKQKKPAQISSTPKKITSVSIKPQSTMTTSLADRNLMSLLNQPGFFSKCAAELRTAAPSASSSHNKQDTHSIMLNQKCNDLDKLNHFVSRSCKHLHNN